MTRRSENRRAMRNARKPRHCSVSLVAQPVGPVNEPVASGPPPWAKAAQMGGLAGTHFLLQEGGTLCCPANHLLSLQERRAERGGSLRLVYGARPQRCAECRWREPCLVHGAPTKKPRRARAVIWPLKSGLEEGASHAPLAPVTHRAVVPDPARPERDPRPDSTGPGGLSPLALPPLLFGDWQRCAIRRGWMNLIRPQAVTFTIPSSPVRSASCSSGFGYHHHEK